MREISEKISAISECKAGFLRVKQRFLGFLPVMTKISGSTSDDNHFWDLCEQTLGFLRVVIKITERSAIGCRRI